jgi:hypothetical protein
VAPLFDAGQALFNSPTLLGGQAAKAGLSCASCHVNGRDNPHFVMAGVSGKPGTSDVTSSFFSAARGNGQFDPIPIPDLAMPGKVSRNAGDQLLERFIRNLIVEEFAGAEPSPATLESLATYVRAIEPCDNGNKTPVTRDLHDQMTIMRGALKVAGTLTEKGDHKEAGLLIAAARHQLGLVSERYAGPGLKAERALLLKASRELQSLAETAGDGQAFAKWQVRFEKDVARRLFQKQGQSLYNPSLLATHFAPKGEAPSKR